MSPGSRLPPLISGVHVRLELGVLVWLVEEMFKLLGKQQDTNSLELTANNADVLYLERRVNSITARPVSLSVTLYLPLDQCTTRLPN